MKGENKIEKFREVAEELASKISSFESVTGIVFIGGLVRGFADKFSDLDIIVFLDRKNDEVKRQIYALSHAVERRYSIDVDMEVHCIEDFRKWKWDEIDRWEFSKARIVFDPKKQIREMFSARLKLPEDFWIKRIAVCSEYLRWYCCPINEKDGTVAESWIERGDLTSAHYCLTYAVELLLKGLFALNKEFLPAPKWRIHYSYGLRWLPENYRDLMKETMIAKDFSKAEFYRRLKAVRDLWKEIISKIEKETGLTQQEISKYYVSKILHINL